MRYIDCFEFVGNRVDLGEHDVGTHKILLG